MKRISGIYSKQLKNRSSKDIYFSGMVGPGTKPIQRSMSNAHLNELSKKYKDGFNIYSQELNRRNKKRAKKGLPPIKFENLENKKS